MTKVFKYYST